MVGEISFWIRLIYSLGEFFQFMDEYLPFYWIWMPLIIFLWVERDLSKGGKEE